VPLVSHLLYVKCTNYSCCYATVGLLTQNITFWEPRHLSRYSDQAMSSKSKGSWLDSR